MYKIRISIYLYIYIYKTKSLGCTTELKQYHKSTIRQQKMIKKYKKQGNKQKRDKRHC